MYYIISFVVLARRSEPVLLVGPEGFDLYDEYRRFKERISGRLPQGSFLEPRSTWALAALELLREFQLEYNCTGDYEAIFIEHLIQRCGFERRRSADCRLA